jgi:hypothetical protein
MHAVGRMAPDYRGRPPCARVPRDPSCHRTWTQAGAAGIAWPSAGRRAGVGASQSATRRLHEPSAPRAPAAPWRGTGWPSISSRIASPAVQRAATWRHLPGRDSRLRQVFGPRPGMAAGWRPGRNWETAEAKRLENGMRRQYAAHACDCGRRCRSPRERMCADQLMCMVQPDRRVACS